MYYISITSVHTVKLYGFVSNQVNLLENTRYSLYGTEWCHYRASGFEWV